MKTLGEYLLEDGVVTPTQIESALERQREMAARGDRKRLGEILLDMGLVTKEQLQAAIDRQQLERT
jgi:mannitol/fructose-specific phosphotransferase system IIA component